MGASVESLAAQLDAVESKVEAERCGPPTSRTIACCWDCSALPALAARSAAVHSRSRSLACVAPLGCVCGCAAVI